MYNHELIAFRSLNDSDLHYMYKWLNSGFVQKWYGKKNFTMTEVEAKYLPYIRGEKPTQAYLILYDNNPIGYIQTYKIVDYPKYAKEINVFENAAGLDLFIGEEDYIHKGLGKFIIGKFLEKIVYKTLNVDSCILGPEPNNLAAIKTYEKVGFRHLKTVKIDEGFEYLMRIELNDLKSF